MQNKILEKRICKLIAMSYALNEQDVWKVFEKLNSIDKLLNIIQENRFEEFKNQ